MVKTAVVSIVMIIVACVGWSGMPSDASGAAGTETPENPKGKRIFSRHCAGCHGAEGKGDGYKLLGPDPANLTAPATRKKPDSALLTTIHEGKPNMPSWKGILSDHDIQSVLAYIRTLPH